eukprot:jgi/Chrzof1/8120/UNPLg00165.t1
MLPDVHLTRELSSRTVVLCAQYGVGGDLSLLPASVACFVTHTQPHFACPVLSVDLPCLTSYKVLCSCAVIM